LLIALPRFGVLLGALEDLAGVFDGVAGVGVGFIFFADR
jgi:hypothetical protein